MPPVREHRSLWNPPVEHPEQPPLAGDTDADVVVVGAGITGLTTALLIARGGRDVLVIERDRVGCGVTGHTTAHLSTAVDVYYHEVAKKFGDDGARLLGEATREAVDRIEDLVREERIDCDFRRVPGYLYAEPGQDDEIVRREVDAAVEAGLPARLDDEVPLPFRVTSGARFERQGALHPLRYLSGLARAFTAAGGRIAENTRVTDLEDGEPCRVVTDHGVVTARAVLECTHVPLQGLLTLHPRVYPYRSYVLGLRVEETLPDALFWDVASPYHYTRRVDHDGAPLLLVGGADHKTGEEHDTEACYETLAAYARGRYRVNSIEYGWSSQVYEPADRLPFIGRKPRKDHLYVATGYSGDGLTFGTVAGRLLADLVLERASPYADLFDPGRIKPLASVGRLISENADVAFHFLKDRLFAARSTELDRLGRDEGMIVEVEGEQVAVYRDAEGHLHAISPQCSHAGCIVQWNGAERTWDCPCHGGRFDADGRVLNGPPVDDLHRVPLRDRLRGDEKA